MADHTIEYRTELHTLDVRGAAHVQVRSCCGEVHRDLIVLPDGPAAGIYEAIPAPAPATELTHG